MQSARSYPASVFCRGWWWLQFLAIRLVAIVIAVFTLQQPTVGLCVAHFATMVARSHLALRLSCPKYHRRRAFVPRVTVLRHLVAGDMTIMPRRAVKLPLHTWLMTTGLATRKVASLHKTCVGAISKLTRLIKVSRSL